MPDASASAGTAVPAVAEASLFPVLAAATAVAAPAATAPATPPSHDAPAAAASRDSLAYGYYGQTLGLKLAHTENKSLLQTVTDWLGTPYSYGNSSHRGIDCSGFVGQVFKRVYGITLKRSSRSMFSQVQRVRRADMKPGDLVFFGRGKGNSSIYHVGIYLKNGRFAHSACNGGVQVSSLDEDYYSRNFYTGGRVAGTSAQPHAPTQPELQTLLAAVASVRPE